MLHPDQTLPSMGSAGGDYFIPIHLPSLLRRPARVSGMPVALAILRLALVTPNARFHENEIPGPSFTICSPFFGCPKVSLDLPLVASMSRFGKDSAFYAWLTVTRQLLSP